MSIGLQTKIKVQGLKELQNEIEYIKKISKLKNDKYFIEYLQNKFIETVNSISTLYLPNGDMKEQYIKNNKITQTENGFILYNDSYIATDLEGYNGSFSIALAFEYGTGIIGQENPKVGAWAYNINNHEKGWVYFKEGSFHFTKGMQGYEIYRFTAETIREKIYSWVKEYANYK